MTEKPTYEELEKRIQELNSATVELENVKGILKEKEEFNSCLLDNSPHPIIVINQDTSVRYVNPALEELTGYSSVEILATTTPYLWWTESTQKKTHQDFSEALQIGARRVEELFVKKNGEQFWVEITSMPTIVNGKINYYLANWVDITERKGMEENLRENEEKYRSFFENSSVSLWEEDYSEVIEYMNGLHESGIKDLRSYFNDYPEEITKCARLAQILDVNPATLKMYEAQSKEDLIQNLNDVFTNESLEVFKEQLISFFEGNMLFETDGITQTLLGKKNHIHLVTSLLSKHRVLVSITDITERKQAEDALRESEEKYRSMMESMKDASYICSPELHIEYMNPAMIDRVGTDATGKLCYKAIYNRDEKCSWCVLDQIKKGESLDYEVADPKNNRYYSVSNSPIFHFDGTVSKLTIFHDITEIKDIEAQLQQSRKMESIGTLAGGVAHDFNNLLYMISGNAELALEDIPKWNPVHTNLEEIKSASLRAAGIVKQLLRFSRKTDQELKPIGAVTVIKETLKFLRSTIPTTIEIRKHLPDADITIFADPVQINQVLMNLCINASQAMEDTGGILEVNIEMTTLEAGEVKNFVDLNPGKYLKMTVSDTGSGIAEEIINRIFDPYFTTKEMGKGSGMGLSIVHGIVQNHNGTISVDSKLGKGTTFSLLFPVVDERPKIETETIDEIPRGHETILFVDDEKSITDMTQKMLKRLGYKVETSLNPLQALDLFQSKPDSFDIVITDMTMPQMTGAKLSKKLMEIRSDIPVIICTGHSSLIDEEKAIQFGIADYVLKPASMSTIAKTIRKVLDK